MTPEDRREAEALVLKWLGYNSTDYLDESDIAHVDAILAYGQRCAARAVEERFALLKAHADDSLRQGGQRVRPPLFVPSVAKRVLEMLAPPPLTHPH